MKIIYYVGNTILRSRSRICEEFREMTRIFLNPAMRAMRAQRVDDNFVES